MYIPLAACFGTGLYKIRKQQQPKDKISKRPDSKELGTIHRLTFDLLAEDDRTPIKFKPALQSIILFS